MTFLVEGLEQVMFQRIGRKAAGVALTVLIAAGFTLTAGPAQAAPSATVSAGSTQGMAGPSLNFYQHRTFARGKALQLACYEIGQSVTGYYSPWVAGGRSNIWYQTVGDGGVWVPDIDINTGSNSPVTARCPANLPWTEGAAYRVTQAPGSSYSHANAYNRYAIDFGLPQGTVLRAPETGEIHYAGWANGGGGYSTFIKRRGTNTCILLAHQSSISVSAGQTVIRGQVIGRSGATGNATGPHLHLDVVGCSTWYSQSVLSTQERGRSYPNGVVAASWNAR